MVAAQDTGSRAVESSETTVSTVISFCHDKLGVSITPDDISTAHHIKAKRPGDPTQVIVRFARRSKRDAVLQARGKLRAINVDRAANNRVYINEDLSENTRKIFGAARAKLKSKLLTSAWTSNGRIHVKDNNGSFHTISSMSQLQAVARIS
jgi:hypothetical protein